MFLQQGLKQTALNLRRTAPLPALPNRFRLWVEAQPIDFRAQVAGGEMAVALGRDARGPSRAGIAGEEVDSVPREDGTGSRDRAGDARAAVPDPVIG